MDERANRLARIQTLTERQFEVFRLLTQGRSHAQIAAELVVEKATVQFHVSNIYQKLEIADLERGPRQRELVKFGLTLTDAADKPAVPPARPVAAALDEPSPQNLALVRILPAVFEDEPGLLKWEASGGDLAVIPPEVISRGGRPPLVYTPRRPWLVLALPFIVGIVVGVGLTAALVGGAGRTPVSSGSPTSPPVATPGADADATGSAARTATGGPSVPPPTAAAATSPTSACGEPARITAPLPDLFRSQGVTDFSVENTGSAILTDKVRALAIDARGLWIGYYTTDQQKTAGLGQYDKTTWANCSAAAGLANQNVNAIAVDHTGNVWVATENVGVAMWDGTTWHRYTTETGLPSNETFGLTVDQDNHVWLATLEGIARYDGKRWNTIYTAANKTIYYNNTHAIAFDRAGNIWVGHISDGISVYNKTQDQWIHYTAARGGLGGNSIRRILVQTVGSDPAADSVWFATADGGISRFAGGAWTVYHLADGLPSEDVEDLALDHYGRVWAATLGGVVYWDGKQWIVYDHLPAYSLALGADCQTCPFEANDHVWTGTASSGLTHSRLPYPDRAVTITQVCFESAQRVRTCQDYPAEKPITSTAVITVTYPQVLHPGDTFQAEIYAAPNTPYKFQVGDMLVDTDDQLLFGTFEHIAVPGTVESAQPFEFVDFNKPFTAPQLAPNVPEQTFISTWRMWTHTRYAGPYVRIVFTVRRP